MEQRFMREAQNTAGLRHPHVVEVLDFGRDPASGFYIVYVIVRVSITPSNSRNAAACCASGVKSDFP